MFLFTYQALATKYQNMSPIPIIMFSYSPEGNKKGKKILLLGKLIQCFFMFSFIFNGYLFVFLCIKQLTTFVNGKKQIKAETEFSKAVSDDHWTDGAMEVKPHP